MYGSSYSCTHTEGQLYATIPLASFSTMTSVSDIKRVDCFQDKQWKVMNITSTYTHTNMPTKELIWIMGHLSGKPLFVALYELLSRFCFFAPEQPESHKRINISKAWYCEWSQWFSNVYLESEEPRWRQGEGREQNARVDSLVVTKPWWIQKIRIQEKSRKNRKKHKETFKAKSNLTTLKKR